MVNLKYTHRFVIALTIVAMIYTLSRWAGEYQIIDHTRNTLINQIAQLRNNIYQDAYQFQDKVRDYEKLQHERSASERRIQEVLQSRPQQNESDKPVTRPLMIIESNPPLPPPPRVEDTSIPSKIHLLGIMELELSETTSWTTLLKMIATVLTTFFGIKLINLIFQKLEKSVA